MTHHLPHPMTPRAAGLPRERILSWLLALGRQRARPQPLPGHLHHDLGMPPAPQPVYTFIR